MNKLPSISQTVYHLNYNSNHNVTCHIYGINAKLSWFKNTWVRWGHMTLSPVPQNMTYGVSSLTPQNTIENNLTLMFTNITVNDVGKYFCKVTLYGRQVVREVDIQVDGKFVLSILLYHDLN